MWWGETEFSFHPPGALYLPGAQILVIADLHLGKAAHFRKNGIPLPKMVNQNNHWKLSALLDKLQPQSILFLGDLFHSTHNEEWEEWIDFLDNYPSIKRILVSGNHDILNPEVYASSGFLSCDIFRIDQLIFTHDVIESVPDGFLNICGHVHPAIRLSSAVHRGLRLPCFYLHKQVLLVPAFGEFTGMKVITPSRSAKVLAIMNDEIIDLSAGAIS